MKKLILSILIIATSCEASNYDNLIRFYARKHGIDFKLAKSLVEVESSFNRYAVSNKNAIGLTQVVYKWHYKMCGLKTKHQLFNPHFSLDCGFKVLSFYIRQCNGIKKGLACYNAGQAGARKGLGYGYARKVLKIRREL
jgi:soluble lytic murein transglycosylase